MADQRRHVRVNEKAETLQAPAGDGAPAGDAAPQLERQRKTVDKTTSRAGYMINLPGISHTQIGRQKTEFMEDCEDPPPHWREEDFIVVWHMVREGRKNTSEGYITSKQMRMFLTYFGVSFHQAAHEIPPQLMYTFQEACDKAMKLSPPTKMMNKINRLLVATDWRESAEGKVRGHLDHQSIELYLKDHGLEDEEILLALMPYRTLDGDVNYPKMLKDFFPPEDSKPGTFHF